MKNFNLKLAGTTSIALGIFLMSTPSFSLASTTPDPTPCTELKTVDLETLNTQGELSCTQSAPCPNKDLACSDLSGQPLVYVYLNGAKLPGSILGGEGLYLTEFSHADLRNTKFLKMTGGGLNLNGADLRGADLTDLNFQQNSITAQGAIFNLATKLPFSKEEALSTWHMTQDGDGK